MDVSPEFWAFYQHAAAAAVAMAASQSSGGTNPSSSDSSGTTVPICTPTVLFNGSSVPSASTASGSQCIDRTASSKNQSPTFHNDASGLPDSGMAMQSQNVYGAGKQDAATLAKANKAIKEATKGKKAIDDQNREEAIKKQRKIEEEDRIKNSQQWDKMVESSSKLVDVFQSISSHIINGPAAANNAMNERIGSLESKVDNMLNSLAQLVPLIQQQLNQNKNG
jgi:hypothetical protein